MILHQQIPHSKDAPPEPWFAVHCESLTIALCSHNPAARLPVLNIRIILPGTEIKPDKAGLAIANNIRRHTPSARTSALAISTSPISNPTSPISDLQSPIPDYLLLNSLDGTTPAVMHTTDPVFICLADRKTAILQPTEHFRSSVDLSVEGWTYWHEDAHAHFEKLTVEFCQATGIPIPARIAAAVRHT